jgi:hypothetical protein
MPFMIVHFLLFPAGLVADPFPGSEFGLFLFCLLKLPVSLFLFSVGDEQGVINSVYQ